MRINLTEYRPASTSVLGPVGGSTVAPAETATGQTLNDIKNQRDQQIMDMITGGLDATALVLEANKKIKAGEDEITMLKAEEDAKQQSENAFNQVYANQDVTVGLDADEFTYSVDKKLGTYKHQDWASAKSSIEETITQQVLDKIREDGEIDEKLELKLKKRISMSIDRDIHKMESIVLERSGKAVDLAIKKKLNLTYSKIQLEPNTYANEITKFFAHIDTQKDNDVISYTQAEAWKEKVNTEFSKAFFQGMLQTEEGHSVFESYKDKQIWKNVDPLDKIALEAQHAKAEEGITDQNAVKLFEEIIDDPDQKYAGAGGSIALTKILGAEGKQTWQFDKKTGKVNIHKIQGTGQFSKVGTKALTALVNKAKAQLESDWKGSSTLTSDETKTLNQMVSQYGSQMSVYTDGFGGDGTGTNYRRNVEKLPDNFLKYDIFAGKNIEKYSPNLKSSIPIMNNIMGEMTDDLNKFVSFDLSKSDYNKLFEDKRKQMVEQVKHPSILSAGLRTLQQLKNKFQPRIKAFHQDESKLNFMDIYFREKIKENFNGIAPAIGSSEYNTTRANSLRAQLMFFNVPGWEQPQSEYKADLLGKLPSSEASSYLSQ